MAGGMPQAFSSFALLRYAVCSVCSRHDNKLDNNSPVSYNWAAHEKTINFAFASNEDLNPAYPGSRPSDYAHKILLSALFG